MVEFSTEALKELLEQCQPCDTANNVTEKYPMAGHILGRTDSAPPSTRS